METPLSLCVPTCDSACAIVHAHVGPEIVLIYGIIYTSFHLPIQL